MMHSTVKGRLIHKKVLEEHAQIPHAYKYRCHDYQARYQDPANQLDEINQTLVSYKKYKKGDHDDVDSYRVKLVKLNVFKQGYSAFEANCEILCTC